MGLLLLANRESPERTPRSVTCNRGRHPDGICTHRHTPDGLDLRVEHLEDGLADETCAGAVERGLAGVQVPTRGDSRPQAERPIKPQSVVSQVVEKFPSFV
jgi:hypothetical protein